MSPSRLRTEFVKTAYRDLDFGPRVFGVGPWFEDDGRTHW